jgi:hypothetical protein
MPERGYDGSGRLSAALREPLVRGVIASMKRLLLLSAAVAILGACRETTDPVAPNGSWSVNNTWGGQVIITEDTDGRQWPADPVTISNAVVRGDSLELSVSFGGGCREHTFLLLSDAAWMESYPVQVGVKLSHDSKGDNCKALLSRVLRFDLSPLKSAYQASYQTTTGIIRLNIRGTSSVTYSW